MAIVGHTLSPFLKFKGGKGVATGLGALLGTAWLGGVIGFGMFLVCLALTRYVSVSSVVGAASAAVAALMLGLSPAVSAAYVLVAVYIIVKHRANFERLRKGEEPKIEKKAAPPT
jgi:glycerol-3-phosphate acyltransferase PlsY